ncbi:MAG: tetratricopeptide repeat protein [Cyanobacteria bacterium J06638_20]
MKRVRFSSHAVGLLVAIATVGSIAWNAPTATAQDSILQEQGVLESLVGRHVFSGTAGQAVVISIMSTDFSGGLTILDPTGTELVSNEGFARDPNVSTVFVTLPSDGDYTIVARSPFGAPGDYTVQVRVATPYDEAYERGNQLLLQGNYREAIEAFEEAVSLDPSQPAAYLNLADAVYGEATRLQPNELESISSNYLRAADLYEAQGNLEQAEILREQVRFLQEISTGGF